MKAAFYPEPSVAAFCLQTVGCFAFFAFPCENIWTGYTVKYQNKQWTNAPNQL